MCSSEEKLVTNPIITKEVVFICNNSICNISIDAARSAKAEGTLWERHISSAAAGSKGEMC